MTATVTSAPSRRQLLASAAGALVLAGAPALARADEGEAGVMWDASYDVLVLGSGFSGMAAAMGAADAGARVLVVEKAPEGESGGNSRVCGQMFAYSNGDVDAAKSYYTALAAGRDIPEDYLDVMAHGIANITDMLAEVYGMDASGFMNAKETPFGYLSPEYPEKPGADKMALWASHDGVADSYLFQYLRERMATQYADGIEFWYESPATALIQDPTTKEILGVTVEHDGSSVNIQATGGVCLCVGGFENNEAMKQDYLCAVGFRPFGTLYNTGDGITMAQRVGASMWHMSAFEGMNYGLPVGPEDRYASLASGMTSGAAMVVGTLGRRVMNEVGGTRHGHASDGNGCWENPRFPERVWLAFDQAQMDAIDADGLLDDSYRDQLMTFSSIQDAETALEIPEGNLATTINEWNLFCTEGKDYQFDRPVDTMRAFEGDTIYALPLGLGIMNTQGGPRRNAQAQVLDADGQPIVGLYSAGELGGWTAFMYQGGTNVAECLIMGRVAGTNAASRS